MTRPARAAATHTAGTRYQAMPGSLALKGFRELMEISFLKRTCCTPCRRVGQSRKKPRARNSAWMARARAFTRSARRQVKNALGEYRVHGHLQRDAGPFGAVAHIEPAPELLCTSAHVVHPAPRIGRCRGTAVAVILDLQFEQVAHLTQP